METPAGAAAAASRRRRRCGAAAVLAAVLLACSRGVPQAPMQPGAARLHVSSLLARASLPRNDAHSTPRPSPAPGTSWSDHASSRGDRVLVLCAHARGTPLAAPLAAAAARNHQAYAVRHGYDYRHIGSPPRYYLALAQRFDRQHANARSRRGPRYKAFAILEAFAEGYTQVLALDADTLVVDMARSVQRPPFVGGSAESVSLFFSGTASAALDSGAVLLRRREWSVDVLLSGLTGDAAKWGRCGDGDQAEWLAAVTREADEDSDRSSECAIGSGPGCVALGGCTELRRRLPLHLREEVRPLPPEELQALPLPASASDDPSQWGVHAERGHESEVWPDAPHPRRLANSFIIHFPEGLSEQMRLWARFVQDDGTFALPVAGDHSELTDEALLKLLRQEAPHQPPLPAPAVAGSQGWMGQGVPRNTGWLGWVVAAACAATVGIAVAAIRAALPRYSPPGFDAEPAPASTPAQAWRQAATSPPPGGKEKGKDGRPGLRSRSLKGAE